MTPVSIGDLWRTDEFCCFEIGRRLYFAGSFAAQRQAKRCAELEAISSKSDILISAPTLRVVRWLKPVTHHGKLIHSVWQVMLVFPIHDRYALEVG